MAPKSEPTSIAALDDRPSKRARKEEPYVTIIVGGEKFRHNRQILCVASDVFDRKLHSGLNESLSLTIVFPHKDPEEWKLFASFLEPVSGAKITESNVETLVPWFHEFDIAYMLNECDKVYYRKIFPEGKTFCERDDKDYGKLDGNDLKRVRKDFDTLTNVCEFSQNYGLVETQEEALYHLDHIVWCKEDILDLKCVTKFVALLQARHEVLRRCVLNRIKTIFPRWLKDEDLQLLVSKESFPHLLLMMIEKNVAQILVERAPESNMLLK
jgi:hypothetical protein